MKKDKRILYIDILKVIALILMPCIHAYGILYTFNFINEKINVDYLCNQFGVIYLIVPTIFMFTMGCGLYLSNNNSPNKLAKRGLKLLFYGFILNVLRGFIFYLILGIFKSSEYAISEGWYWLWGSDILYFAGLFFLLYALLRKLKLKDLYILIISIIMFAISNIIPTIIVSNDTLNMIVGNFIYLNSDSYFPLLTWSIIPIIGFFFQKHYDLSKNKNLYIVKNIFFSIIVLFATLLITKYTNTFDIRYFLWGEMEFLIDFPTFIITMSINFIFIGIIYFISKCITNKKLINLINDISINVNKIYLIHWVLLMYSALIWLFFIDYKIHYTVEIYIYGIIAFIISFIISKKWK